jgi:hypothetical protein
MEIAVRAFPVFGRPRGFSILLATVSSKSSGSASAAGRALENVALVHSGFSTAFLLVLTLRFIVFRLTEIGFPQADYVDSSRTRRKHQGMQPSGNQAERLISALSVVFAEIFNYKRCSPFELFRKVERNSALGDTSLVPRRVEANGHDLLYIRVYDNAIARRAGRPYVRAKRSANSRPPRPGWRKHTAYHRSGPGGLPLALRLSEGLGRTGRWVGVDLVMYEIVYIEKLVR